MARLTPLLEQMLAPLGVELILRWQGQPRHLLLDGTGVEQLLVNLVKNGAESAAQAGAQSTDAEPRVELRIDFEPDRLRLEVQDNGPGLTASQAQLRQAFYSSKADGMGLGLAICRDVVEFHRGHFSLRDAQPRGCLAWVELPVPPPEADASQPSRN
ncbi:Sensor histidine kinase TodS [compost metagenome]